MLKEISGLAGNSRIVSESADHKNVQKEESVGQLVEQPAEQTQNGVSPAALAEFSEEWTEKNWQDLTKKTIEQLKKLYPSLDIIVARSEDSVSDLAVSLGKGSHLVISEEFLKRMCSNAEEFGKCSTVLTDIARQLSEQSGNHYASGAYVRETGASFWSVQAPSRFPVTPEQGPGINSMIKQEKAETFKLSKSSNTYQVSGYYNKVAAAKSKMQVQFAMADIHRCMVELRMAALSSDEKESMKAKKAIRSLNKLLGRGNRKIKQLNQEDVTQARQKRAEREMKEKKAKLARMELKKMRSDRNRKDKNLQQEGVRDEAGIRNSYGYYSARNAYQRMMMLTPDLNPVMISAGTMVASDVSFSAADVVVSDVVAF